MREKEFNDLVAQLDATCGAVLFDRAKAYAEDEDRLANFKQIAALTGLSASTVCMVLQAKHIVALAKAVREGNYERTTEYITDIINYQRLLHALIMDEKGMLSRPTCGGPLPPEAGYIHTNKRPE